MRLALPFPVLLAAALLCAAPAGAFWWSPKGESSWSTAPVVMDGDLGKWRPREQDDFSGMEYAFVNDADWLYLMLYPHTREAKEQLSGARGGDFTIILSTGKPWKGGLRITLAPPDGGPGYDDRDLSVSGACPEVALSSGAAAPEIRSGSFDDRGILEARIPLVCFGAALPEEIGVGLQAPPGTKHLAVNASFADDRGGRPRSGAEGGGAGDDETSPLHLWIKVRLAPAPHGPPGR